MNNVCPSSRQRDRELASVHLSYILCFNVTPNVSPTLPPPLRSRIVWMSRSKFSCYEIPTGSTGRTDFSRTVIFLFQRPPEQRISARDHTTYGVGNRSIFPRRWPLPARHLPPSQVCWDKTLRHIFCNWRGWLFFPWFLTIFHSQNLLKSLLKKTHC